MKQKTSINIFPIRTLLFQTSHLIRWSKDMLARIDMKCFLGKLGERYSFRKKLESQHENTASSASAVNEVMEAVMACEDDPSVQDPVCNITDEDGSMELFDQFSGLMSPMLNWLVPNTVAINKVSLQGKVLLTRSQSKT